MKRGLALFILLIVYLAPGPLFAQTEQNKPNIVLIMVDDLGYGDLGCYGQQKIRTPNIDAMASQGIRFTDYYSGSTVCAPSREALLTGKHTGHTFIRGNFLTNDREDPALPTTKKTIAEILKEEGYYTGLIGKWGLGGEGKGPETQGFDYSYGYLDQINAHNYYPPFLFENGKKVILEENADGKQGSYSHHLFNDKTTDFINEQNPERPFFLYLPYTLPHGKHVIPDNSLYSDEDWPDRFKNYAAMISLLDKSVKGILDQLKEKHLDKNTVVFFTSDNGANPEFAKFFNSNGKLRGAKRDLYEGGIRVPMITYWPGKINGGQISDHITAAWDFFPTIAQLASVKIKDSVDGISFYNTLFKKGTQGTHPYLYWENYTYNYNWNEPNNTVPRNWLNSKAVRMGQWKAVKKKPSSAQKDVIELYNLQTDEEEENNVADDNPDIIKEIGTLFETSSTKNAPYFPYRLHTIDLKSANEIRDFFQFSPEKKPMVSAHRGGPRPGFPENCIPTFENTLLHTPAILEIDPHYTKDGHIILMHDATLDRTTNGFGKVADHTLSELKKLRLKDTEGNLTNYQIPTLDEALQWAKGKTILVVDEKDVPIETRIKKIIENKAEANAIVIAYSLEDIKKAYQLNKHILMEVMMGKKENIKQLDDSGVPWQNVVGFIGHNLPSDQEIITQLHKRGVMCIQGSSRNIDRSFIAEEIDRAELNKGYLDIIASGVDIIETDLGIEAGASLKK